MMMQLNAVKRPVMPTMKLYTSLTIYLLGPSRISCEVRYQV